MGFHNSEEMEEVEHLLPRVQFAYLKYKFLSATTKPTTKKTFEEGRKGRTVKAIASSGKADLLICFSSQSKVKLFLTRLKAKSQNTETATSRRSSRP